MDGIDSQRYVVADPVHHSSHVVRKGWRAEVGVMSKAILVAVLLVSVAAATAALYAHYRGGASPPAGQRLKLDTQHSVPANRDLAGIEGRLHGRIVAGTACMWIGDSGARIIWPHGYSATRSGGTITIRDDTGLVIAHPGDMIQGGGGFIPASEWTAATPCRKGAEGFSILDEITSSTP